MKGQPVPSGRPGPPHLSDSEWQGLPECARHRHVIKHIRLEDLQFPRSPQRERRGRSCFATARRKQRETKCRCERDAATAERGKSRGRATRVALSSRCPRTRLQEASGCGGSTPPPGDRAHAGQDRGLCVLVHTARAAKLSVQLALQVTFPSSPPPARGPHTLQNAIWKIPSQKFSF